MTSVTACSSYIESNFYKQCFIPEIAEELGIVESIIIDKLDYWIKKSGKIIDNQLWIYNTFEDWSKQLKFFSISTIKRAFYSLEKKGYIYSKKMNVKKSNHTKWYSINYSTYMDLLVTIKPKKFASVQNALSSDQIDTNINSKQNTNYSIKLMSNDINLDSQTNHKESDLKICNLMIDTWNEIFINSTSKIILTNKRKHKLQLLWKSVFNQNLEEWHNYCLSINSSKFLMGEKKESFKAHFDWLIEQKTVDRIRSGEFDIGDRVPDIKKEEQEIKALEAEQELNLKLSAIRAQKDKEEVLRTTERLAEKLSIEELTKLEEGWNDQEKAKIKSAFEAYMEHGSDDDFINEYKPLFKNKWATIGAELAYEQFKIKFYLKKSFKDFINEAKAFIDRNGFNTQMAV